MERECYINIIKVNLKHNFMFPFCTTVLAGILTVLLFNVKALSYSEAIQPIELLLTFTGIMMLTPVFLPEQNPAIRDVIRSKWADYTGVCLIRLIYSIMTVVIIDLIFLGFMKMNESDVGMYHIVVAVAGAMFLGAIGFCVSGITGNTTLGYMIAMAYYLINYGVKEKLGIFNLFSGEKGTYTDKGWLFLWTVILFIIPLVVLKIKNTIQIYKKAIK